MRAARFHGWGTAPVVDEVPEPARADGEVLVQVRAAAVAHLDATIAGGTFGLKPPLPYVGGVEGAGVVLEAGDLAPGTQVMLRGGGLGVKRDGTWTERVRVPRKAVLPLDPELPAEVAATFFVPATTGYVAVHDVGRVEPGDHVIVTGAAGAVGAMAAQQALAAGARVLGAVSREDGLSRIPAGVEGFALSDTARLAELAKQRPAAVLIDTVGGRDLAARAKWVRPGGRAVLIGYAHGPAVEIDLSSWLLDDVAFLPVNMIRQERRARAVAGGLLRQLAAGELRVETQTFELDGIADALAALRAGRVRGRAVVTPR
ncbi:quinone oxidoreductase family protein [Amycolatopsis jiangsuensis]|uniref:NADPH2:quinone reductase n=1 Tax=Amycolatopsis jiangsuensis TaxID=1181879 RepID=A0A840IPM2_9PSEU|nr:zinc-binding dehydrogenase [Amycolatopsis jiangsuensis]MBB4683880.1 NADPH2:quinone reductase [Amycolatopsis jiangsuensis]